MHLKLSMGMEGGERGCEESSNGGDMVSILSFSLRWWLSLHAEEQSSAHDDGSDGVH